MVESFFLCSTLNTLCHLLLACKVSAEKSADYLMGFTLWVISWFSLVFRSFSLSLTYTILIMTCLGVCLLKLMFIGTLWNSWTWMSCFLLQIREVFSHISSDDFSGPFSLSSYSGIYVMQMIFCFMLSQWFLKSIPLFKIHFASLSA